MSDTMYRTFSGTIQFDLKEVETDKGDLREATIRLTNQPEGKLVQVAFFDNSFEEVEMKKGDFIVVDGTFRSRFVEGEGDKDDRTYLNCTATSVTVVPVTKIAPKKGDSGGERKTSNTKKDKASSEPAF